MCVVESCSVQGIKQGACRGPQGIERRRGEVSAGRDLNLDPWSERDPNESTRGRRAGRRLLGEHTPEARCRSPAADEEGGRGCGHGCGRLSGGLLRSGRERFGRYRRADQMLQFAVAAPREPPLQAGEGIASGLEGLDGDELKQVAASVERGPTPNGGGAIEQAERGVVAHGPDVRPLPDLAVPDGDAELIEHHGRCADQLVERAKSCHHGHSDSVTLHCHNCQVVKGCRLKPGVAGWAAPEAL